MRLAHRVASLALPLLVALCASSGARAQGAAPGSPPPAAPGKAPANDAGRGLPPGESEESGARTLSGHTFQRPVFLDSAFVAGYFGDGTRIGYENATFSPKEQLNVATVFETLAFGVPVGKRVQISFDGNYNARFGTDTQSLFGLGGTFGFRLEPGVRVLIVRSESTGSQLSVHGSGVIAYSPGVSPANLITILGNELNGITTNPKRVQCLLKLKFRCAFPGVNNILAAIETSSTAFGGDVAVNFAQAAGRYAGVQATAAIDVEGNSFSGYTGTKQFSSSSTPVAVEGGFGPSLNLYPIAPVGLQLEYLARFTTEASNGNATNSLTHNFAAGFFYTGRRDLQLGVSGTISIDNETTTTTRGASNSTSFDSYTGAFGLYYYF